MTLNGHKDDKVLSKILNYDSKLFFLKSIVFHLETKTKPGPTEN